MPKPKTRAEPRSAATASMISGSLPMNPSVQKTTMRSRRGSAGAVRAARMPVSISVPPPPERRASQLLARATFSAVPGTGAAVIDWAAPSNATSWKVSSGPIASSARATSAFARSMGAPIIEPDLSTRNTSSFGRTSAGATSAGGCRNSMRNSSPCSRCTSACAAGRLAGGLPGEDEVLVRHPVVLGEGDEAGAAPSTPVTTRWLFDTTSSNAAAGTSRTRMSTSAAGCPPGGTTGGVTRDASGTRSVSAAQPGPPRPPVGVPGT